MIPNSSLIVSSTEPTGKNRKKVWMQKGKNLFDKDNVQKLDSFLSSTDNKIKASSNSKLLYIACLPNYTYTISKLVTTRFSVAYTSEKPAEEVSVGGYIENNTAKAITIIFSILDNFTSKSTRSQGTFCTFFIHYGSLLPQ